MLGGFEALAVLGLACLAPAVHAQGSVFGDRLLAAYSKLDAYCARARESEQAGGDAGQVGELEHCVLRDGRFRSVRTSSTQIAVEWSDGEFEHFHHRYIGDRPFDSYGRVPAVRMIAPGVPPILQRSLGWYGLAVADVESLHARFKAFEPNEEQSTAALVAYEVPAGDPWAGQRVWVGREDGLIRRVGWSNPDLGEIVLTEVQLDPALAPEALLHEAPASAVARYFARRYFLELALALSALAFGLGVAYGGLRRRASDESTSRARAWRAYRWVLFVTAPAAVLYAMFAPTGDDMAGAARFVEHIAQAIGWLYVLWLAGLFLLARSLGAPREQQPPRSG